jgi:hypothetical protein
MPSQVYQTIKKIATKIREELESFAERNPGGRFSTEPNLAGMCGYGSVMLYEALSEAGFKPKIAAGHGHWFVVCEGYLVDATATQFGQPKVVVRNYEKVRASILSRKYLREWWNASKLSNDECSAGLCNLKDTIRKARENVQEDCVRCGKKA